MADEVKKDDDIAGAPTIWIPGVFKDEQGQHADDYHNAKFERHPHGIIVVDGKEVAHTLQCPHCMAHFISVKGSGQRRGFCIRCMNVTCGSKECDTCKPFVDEFCMSQGKMY